MYQQTNEHDQHTCKTVPSWESFHCHPNHYSLAPIGSGAERMKCKSWASHLLLRGHHLPAARWAAECLVFSMIGCLVSPCFLPEVPPAWWWQPCCRPSPTPNPWPLCGLSNPGSPLAPPPRPRAGHPIRLGQSRSNILVSPLPFLPFQTAYYTLKQT